MSSYISRVGKRLVISAFVGSVYRKTMFIVDDTPQNAYELQGPIASGTNITLPDSGTYTDKELFVSLNGSELVPGFHYNYVGTAPRTQIQILMRLDATRDNPDTLEFVVQSLG